MKKIMAAALCCCILFTLAACAEDTAPTQTAATTQSPTTETTVPSTSVPVETQPISSAVYAGSLTSISMPVITEKEISDNGTTLSYYSYPDVSISLPDGDVAQVVKLDLLNRIDATTQAAAQIHSAAKADYSGQSDWYNYFLDLSYNVERLDQNVLSLFGTESAFDGSPSSATVGVSANYDLSTGANLNLQSIMFADYSADVLCELIIEGLSKYDEGALFEGYEDVIDQIFSTNVPVESWYFSNSGLCFYFAPYEIAPNAMGIIVSEIPYESLSGLMKEAYFPTEEFVYTGTVDILPMENLENADLEQYSQFGELILGEGGQKYLLTISGSVLNLRVCELKEGAAQSDSVGKMLYAAAGMGPADAVILDFPADMTGLYIAFESDGEATSMIFSIPSEQ